MSKPFVYDEKTSCLYSPDGEFIKKVLCPKALHWNQLIANTPDDRSRGCQQCGDDVINLNVIGIDQAMARFSKNSRTCAFASTASQNVIFLKDLNSPELRKSKADKISWSANGPIQNLPRVSTARNIEDIKRATSIGFWPDVHVVRYRDSEILEKVGLFQNIKTGEVQVAGDFRYLMQMKESPEWEEVMPITYYYSNYHKHPYAAYLIPKDLPDSSEVFIPDPIIDIVGSIWNQGDSYRAINVIGKVVDKKVVINPADIKQSNFIG